MRDVDNARLDIDRERREVESNKQRVEREMHSLTDHTCAAAFCVMGLTWLGGRDSL